MAGPYWLDAGVLITAKNKYYSFKLVPSFWAFLEVQLKLGTVRMPKMSFQEITDGNDELAKWCKERRNIGYFCVKSSHRDVQSRYEVIAEHVAKKYKPHQVAEFLKGADGWVIAHALESHGYVVTDENRRYPSKVKIPIVAKDIGGTWKTLFDMCKELNASFG
jgi:predicted transport protein